MNMNRKERSYLSQLRYGILSIEVEVGLYRQTPLADRLCQFCVNEIEGEKHFIFICPQYEDLRESIRESRKYYRRYSLVTFSYEFETKCIAKFVSSAFTRREVLTAV